MSGTLGRFSDVMCARSCLWLSHGVDTYYVRGTSQLRLTIEDMGHQLSLLKSHCLSLKCSHASKVTYPTSGEVGDTQLHGLILATPCYASWRSFSKALGGDGGNLRRGLETLILSNWLNRRAKNGTMEYKGAVQRALGIDCSGFQIRYIFQVVQRAQCLQSNIYGRRAQSELRSLCTGGNQAALGDRLGLGQPPTALEYVMTTVFDL
ncbi:hypothetical protein BGY98DRAFT_953925 [Russula aff. rugulosa BPL654]|nr:hypothetical protein BGY98DRAFT_953925 [Russula aff. rugulosa BPL654]